MLPPTAREDWITMILISDVIGYWHFDIPDVSECERIERFTSFPISHGYLL
jgi:hypothetical protein